MIQKEEVIKFVQEALETREGELFLVDVKVSAGNEILVEVDRMSGGLSVEDCKMINRYVEGALDREKEDFQLTVSSPDLGKALRMPQQYMKNVGRGLKVKTTDGQKIQADLVSADENGIHIKWEEKERVEGKKKKITVDKELNLAYDDIQEAKVLISFK